MNILVVTPLLLGESASSGGDVSALGFLKSLVPRHTLHVITFDECEDAAEARRTVGEMKQWATTVRAVPHRLGPWQRIKAKLFAMLLIPSAVTRHSCPEFRQACREFLASEPIDLVIAQFPKMAQYAPEFAGVPCVMDVQDAFSVSTFRTCAATRSLGARLLAVREWLSWLLYERRFYAMFDHLFVVSEQDGYGLRMFRPSLKTTVLPRLIPLSTPERFADEEPTYDIGFIGSFKHHPNVLAIEFLFDAILPRLQARMPDLRVVIAGKYAPAELVRRAPRGVEFVGFVPSVDDFYRNIEVIVAPQVTGGGVKIKVIEGLLSGLPVVTTSIGAEGIGLTDGKDARIADEPEAFAAAVQELLESAGKRLALGTAGQRHALRISSPARHAELVDAVFSSVVPSSSARVEVDRGEADNVSDPGNARVKDHAQSITQTTV